MFYPMNSIPALIVFSFTLASHLGNVSPLAAQESVSVPRPTPRPYVVVESPHLVPAFVPYDALLRHADALSPRTPEGWIVMNRPVRDGFSASPAPGTLAFSLSEYSLRLRKFDSQIRLTTAEVHSWQRRLAVYRNFNRADALFIANENAMLSLMEAQERLRNLRYERMLFIRQHQLKKSLPSWETCDEHGSPSTFESSTIDET